MPEFSDFFGKKAIMTLDLGDASSFLEFDPTSGKIKISEDDSSILSKHTGSFKIKYKLTDSQDNSLEYSFLVSVVCLEVLKPKYELP